MTEPWPTIGTPLSQVMTPLPVIDEDRLASNIARTQHYMTAHGLAFRPHIKTHKIPAIARQQMDAGAVGINCQKVTEAEVFADAGFDDILITYNIIGAARLVRLAGLHARVARLRVVADSHSVVAGLAAVMPPAHPLGVLVECDTGAARCGVQTPDQAVALAQAVAAAPGLRFDGLMTYPPTGGAAAVEAFFHATMARLDALGIACPVRSSGGSPDIWAAHLVPSATEHRAGTNVYNDRALLRAGACTSYDLAMHVLATVVSRPTPDRAVLDAGSKTLTSDLLGFDDYGIIPDLPGSRIVNLSEEHGVVDLSGCSGPRPAVGDQVRIVPNHTCVISNLCDRMVFHRDGVVSRVLPVAARGLVW